MKEAMYYKPLDEGRVQCFLCPHNCSIKDGGKGACTVRKNEGGTLYSLNYNRISSIGLDPIEKKPLYHFYPGSYILSVGSIGCNLKCSFCQNYMISQQQAETEEISSDELIREALNNEGNIGIAYTYNEPSIWYEYVYETCIKAKDKGLKNVLVTNGFISEEPLKNILPYVDAMNIDVKGFTERYYRDVCKGILEPVKRTVETAAYKCHIEITTLIVTELNDSIEEIGEIAAWIGSIDKNIPLHLSRYFPNYKLSKEPTPIGILTAAKEEALRHLNYVYVGNLWGYDSTTYCPNCKKPLIFRDGRVDIKGIKDGKCIYCGSSIPVVL